MKNAVTPRQKELLEIVYAYIKDTGYPPTFEEMRERLGVSSNQSVIDLLEKLERKGFIRREESVARGLAILPSGYIVLGSPPLAPFLGMTTAGAPIEAVEISGEWEAVSADAARLKEEVFLLKIIGDSMVNAGIDDGDVVLVENQREFVSGDIVLARVGEETTIKRFVSDDKPPYVYLKPENTAYPLIPFSDGMELTGKVISVMKHGYWKPVK